MKRICLLTATVFITFFSCSQNDIPGKEQAEKNLVDQANKSANHLLQNDFESYVGYMYPGIVKKMGGKERTIREIKSQMANVNTQGIKIISLKFGSPSTIIEAGNGELQAVIPQHHTLSNGKEEITTDGAMVAISSDKGRTWTFIDIAGNDSEGLRKMYPNISAKLPIPNQIDPEN